MAACQVSGRSWGACPWRRTVTGMTARPVPARPLPERVVVVGCAGSGKTTLAREVAARLDARHIERDALGDDEAPGFAALVAAAVEAAGRRWVFDGAPYNAEALVYPHADALVALDYPRRVVWRRVAARSPPLLPSPPGGRAPHPTPGRDVAHQPSPLNQTGNVTFRDRRPLVRRTTERVRPGRRSLTAFSRIEQTAATPDGQAGHPVDPDLRLRILAHWPHTMH